MQFITTWTRTGQEQMQLDRFGNVTLQLRALERGTALIDTLNRVVPLLKEDQTITIALAPWQLRKLWDADTGVHDNIDKIIMYAGILSKWCTILEPFKDKIGVIFVEGEWGTTNIWNDHDKLTDMNNVTTSLIKYFFPGTPMVVYGRGMMAWYTKNIVDLQPWWLGPEVTNTEFITPFLYDPQKPEVENRSMIASAEMADQHDIPLVPFIGIRIKSLGGNGVVDYTPETEFTRGLLLNFYENQIKMVGLYPTPDFTDETWWEHFNWLEAGAEYRQK